MKCVNVRYPRTTNEIRQNAAFMSDHSIIEATGRRLFIRPKRVNLPTAWDDVPKGTYYNNCWKKHRSVQHYRDPGTFTRVITVEVDTPII